MVAAFVHIVLGCKLSIGYKKNLLRPSSQVTSGLKRLPLLGTGCCSFAIRIACVKCSCSIRFLICTGEPARGVGYWLESILEDYFWVQKEFVFVTLFLSVHSAIGRWQHLSHSCLHLEIMVLNSVLHSYSL